jgi:transcriptional antiterminator Rof (Rho-off)
VYLTAQECIQYDHDGVVTSWKSCVTHTLEEGANTNGDANTVHANTKAVATFHPIADDAIKDTVR